MQTKPSKLIERHTGTAANLVIFVLALAVFVTVFFFPEHAGEIAGHIFKGFTKVIQTKP